MRNYDHKQKTADIDLALNVMASLLKPGERVSTKKIADVCGCSPMAIWAIEQAAMKKLRHRFRRELDMEISTFFGAGSMAEKLEATK